ncbi:MAG TPA: TolC family protein, partial [Phycisphaerae bacterium]|nr:TolC family protein [Phycisphaerae bacterium]
MNSHRHPSCRLLAVLLAASCASLAGCVDLLRGWDFMGFQAPPERLRQIETLDLDAMSAGEQGPAENESTEAQSRPTDAEPAKELELTLEQCRVLALAGNLDLKVDLLNPTIAAQGISEAEAAFEAVFNTNVSKSKTDTPTSSTLSGSEVEQLDIRPGIEIPLRTGGSISIDLPMDKVETNSTYSTLNPSYTTDLAVSISQPLLRGGGLRANTHAIRLARLERQKSEALAKLEVIGVLAAVDRVYWQVYAARRELEVRKQEHDLAVAQLERARRQVAAGAKADVEIIRAQLGVAERLEAIILAENEVRDRQRDLKRILQKPGLTMDTPTTIIPVTPPSVDRYRLEAGRIVELALANRMELLELELQIAQDSSAIHFQRNQALPLVTLGYTYNVNGLGSSWSDSFDLLFEKRFEDHRFGLQVEVPIGNQAARSRLRRAILTRIQRLATRQQRQTLIQQEVYNSIDQLEANWQRILAGRQ